LSAAADGHGHYVCKLSQVSWLGLLVEGGEHLFGMTPRNRPCVLWLIAIVLPEFHKTLNDFLHLPALRPGLVALGLGLDETICVAALPLVPALNIGPQFRDLLSRTGEVGGQGDELGLKLGVFLGPITGQDLRGPVALLGLPPRFALLCDSTVSCVPIVEG
jgi:hypothetical protein